MDEPVGGDSDAALLEAARRGDRHAIEQLLARYEHQIYRFALRQCGDEQDARDTLQETMIAALRGLPEFRGEARLSTWLYQIARSFCIKQRRPGHTVRGGMPLSEADAMAAPEAAPDAQAHAREIGAALAAAMSALPESYREAVVLRDVEGLSAEEAAEIAGIDVAALKSRLHRGRLELRRHLAALLGDAGSPVPCPELADELSAYVTTEIDQAACARVEAHLARCPRCAGACEALKHTVSLCRRIPGDEVPPAVRSAVRQALRAAIGGG
ncbi:MAG TPA: sigma-70 family RNA polymerase sigma factor [Kofleriaceae bacterium]|nr:sigma-70 family RNA polymerase sigma factor [Kofleriaceae bacterium]